MNPLLNMLFGNMMGGMGPGNDGRKSTNEYAYGQ